MGSNYVRRTIGALVLGALAIYLLVGGSAGAAEQSAAVTPSAELVNSQFVKVTWSGFSPGGQVYLRQCKRKSTKIRDCTPELVNGLSDPNGSGQAYYQVKEGEVVNDVFSCTFQDLCSIGLFTDEKGTDVDSAVFVPFKLAFPPSACPKPSDSVVSGSGSGAAFRAMLKWSASVCRPPLLLPVQFTLKNSVDGLKDLLTGLTDYSISAMSFDKEQQAFLKKKGRSYSFAPLTTSGLAFGYKLFDRQTGAPVKDLKLTPDLLARIFTGQIRNWNDPEILELNPGYQLPPQIGAVGRADNSYANLLLTSFFVDRARSAYEAGGEAFTNGPVTVYPSTGAVNLKTGAEAVAQTVATGGENSDYSVVGYIGWMDSSIASLYGLDTVLVQNAAGQFVRPGSNTIRAGVAAMGVDDDGLLRPDFGALTPDAYPMPEVTYMVVPDHDVDPGQADVYRGFLEYVAGDGQDLLPAGYVPLTADLAKATSKVAGHIEAADVPNGGGNGSDTPTPVQPDASSSGSPSGFGTGAIPGGEVPPDDLSGDTPPADTASEITGEYVLASNLESEGTRLILPAIVLLGAFGLIAGPLLQVAAIVKRRPGGIRLRRPKR